MDLDENSSTTKLYACSIDGCGYSAKKKWNTKRHIDEHHYGEKKNCVCGKRYTSSSLWRHQLDCDKYKSAQNSKSEKDLLLEQPNVQSVKKNANVPTISYNIAGIDDHEIASVQEHTMTIKVITKKDGDVFFSYNHFECGGKTYVLKPMENENAVPQIENLLNSPESNG